MGAGRFAEDADGNYDAAHAVLMPNFKGFSQTPSPFVFDHAHRQRWIRLVFLVVENDIRHKKARRRRSSASMTASRTSGTWRKQGS